jgi:SAM-dependent methyltransferase/phage shock protein PspC (stress-responsive transcriptional regulator)
MKSWPLALPSILAVSFALLVDEIMLSAIFHVTLGAGNTVAAIAIALVGLSGGGIVAYLVPALREPKDPGALAGSLVFWFAVSLLASVYAIMAVPIGHGDLIYGRADPAVQLWRLLVFHVTVLPFFLGGLTLALIFHSDPSRIGRLYFADLFGASLGCVVSPALLASVGAPVAILLGAAPATLLGAGWLLRAPGWRRALVLLPGMLLVAAGLRPGLLSFATLNTMGEVSAPRYRSFSIEPGDIAYERWALDAWTIIRSEGVPQQWENFRGWGLSPRYHGPIPETRLINYNARFSTYVTNPGEDREALGAWLDADLTSLHHRIGRPYRSVLNIGAGGGREVLAALQHGAERVVAVDISDVVVDDIMKHELREFSGRLYEDPRVEAVADEGRNYAERSRERFDLVEFSIVGGANLEKMDLVRVDDLFTVEALETYFRRLTDEGVFSYLMYSTRADLVAALWQGEGGEGQPYVPALRTLTGLRLALERVAPGARFADHVLMAALPKVISPSYDLVHIIVSRRPISGSERASFLEICRRLDFVALYPDGEQVVDPRNLYARIATDRDLPALAAEASFSIWPATDDRPFQYALDADHLRGALARGQLFGLLAGNPLVSLGLSIGSLSALLALAPLLLSPRQRRELRAFRSSFRLLLYFACIGFAYMAVEIAALLKLQSFLGKPIYGLSVGLFGFLLASGLGSNLTGRLRDDQLERASSAIVLGVAGLGFAFALGSGPLFAGAIGLPLAARIGIALTAVFPVAFLMGMLFPIGVRLLARGSAELIPWAWAINGCFSVLGIFSTRIVALLFGFSRALMLGLVVYLLVIVCVRSARAERPAIG